MKSAFFQNKKNKSDSHRNVVGPYRKNKQKKIEKKKFKHRFRVFSLVSPLTTLLFSYFYCIFFFFLQVPKNFEMISMSGKMNSSKSPNNHQKILTKKRGLRTKRKTFLDFLFFFGSCFFLIVSFFSFFSSFFFSSCHLFFIALFPFFYLILFFGSYVRSAVSIHALASSNDSTAFK